MGLYVFATYPLRLRWTRGYICTSSYYHHQIGSNLSHCCHIFRGVCLRWLCIIFCRSFYFDPRKAGLLFSPLPSSLWYVLVIRYIMALWSYSLVGTLRHLIIIIEWKICFVCHCLGLGHETMVYAVCLTLFLLQFWLVMLRWLYQQQS